MNALHPVPWLLGAALLLGLSGCSPAQGRHATYQAPPAANAGPLTLAEHYLQTDQADSAARQLEQVDATSLGDRDRLRFQLLTAELALAQDRPLQALQALPPPGRWGDTELAARQEHLRAQTLFRIGDPVGGTQAMINRERLLANPEAVRESRALLWELLQDTDMDRALEWRMGKADPSTRGWLELALIARSVWSHPQERERRMAEWQAQYAGHPAAQMLEQMPGQSLAARRDVRQVALILPLSGAYAATADAVRDGFLSGYYQAPSPRPQLRLVDGGDTTESLIRAYRKALDDGAEFIVGPLRKEAVTALAMQGRPPVPVLALNFLEPGQLAPFNFFQVGLAPEDEARQAAGHAVIEHRYAAVALVPEGEWGQRVLAAFEQRLVELGGRVVASRTYASDARDHSEPIRDLMALEYSDDRHRAVTNALGIKTKFEPRRRSDVDVIFIAARADAARQIWQQFRFHRAADLPAYATAQVNEGDKPNADLNGLRFCDMPWMLAAEGEWQMQRQKLREQFPERSAAFPRLQALGRDAFALLTLIEGNQLHPGGYFPAATGTLSLRDNGVIGRGLDCVEIAKGELRPLDIPAVPANGHAR